MCVDAGVLEQQAFFKALESVARCGSKAIALKCARQAMRWP